MGTRSPATLSGYASTIHSSCAPDGERAAEIPGSANARTVLSTAMSSTGSMRTASAAHRLRVVRAGAVPVGVLVVVVVGAVADMMLRREVRKAGGGPEQNNTVQPVQ